MIFSFLSASSANADDFSDVQAVIDRYIKSQTLENMNTQAQLMARDRTYIINGTRYSNNDISMALQTANNAVIRKATPGIKRISTAEDIHVRMNGDTAIVSFYLIMNDINKLGPFGNFNILPIFLIKNISIIKFEIIKNKHVSVIVKPNIGTSIKAICFNCLNTKIGEHLLNYKKNINIIGQLYENVWNNKKTIQLNIKDLIL